MKKIMIIAALAIFSTGIAQNTNEKEVKTTKKTITTDNDGVDINTKTTKTETKTNLAVGSKTYGQNFNTLMKPTSVSTNVDYNYNGINYRFTPHKDGFYLVDNKQAKVARLSPTSQEGYYIYTKKGNNSFGYFNADGDFVVESFDPDNDGVMNYVYKIKVDETMKKKMKEDKMKMKKDKMK